MGKRTQLVLRQEVAKAFRGAIAARKLTVTAAARELGVSRQSLYGYLDADVTPRADVVRRACSRWGLEMNIYGLVVSAATFGKPEGPRATSPIQLTFSDMLQSLRNRNVDIRIIRAAGDSLELKVRIRFAG